MASQLCQRGGAAHVAWNPEPLPGEFRLGSGLSAADPAVLVLAGKELTSTGLEFHALRHGEDSFVLEPVVTMARAGAAPYRVLRWQRALHPYGLVLAGTEAAVEVYNPKKILDAVENTYNTKQVQGAVPAREDFGLLARLATTGAETPNGIVSAIDADPVAMFRLAAGCADGTVQLFDLEQHQRSLVIECSSTATVTALKWHPHTHNVLAGATSAGTIHVLNPKSRKPLLSIVDPNKRQNISGLCWLEAGKNLVVAFDDPQKSSVVQLWDLRHPKFPYREETGPHQGGIVGLEVCGFDGRFFTTASREGRCVTWAMANGSVLPYSEVVLGEPLVDFAVSQSDKLGAVAVQTDSDTIAIHSLDGQLVKDSLCPIVPAWLKRSTGVDFGFAGKLAWFGPAAAGGDRVAFGHVSADADFVAVADELEPFLSAENFAGFCDVKASQAGEAYEAEVWQFIKSAFLPATQRPAHLLPLLGFSAQTVAVEVERFLGHSGGIGLKAAAAEAPKSFTHDNPQDTDNFFDQLANSNDVPAEPKQADAVVETQGRSGYFVPAGSWNSHPLSLMRKAFLTGNPLAAIEVGMRANRWTEAFVLAASIGDPQVMSAVRAGYIEHSKDPFVTTLARAVAQDYHEIVRACTLDQWREAAAVLVTYVYGQPEVYEELCRQLAKRLEREGGDQRAALLVYLMAGQFSDAINLLAHMPSAALKLVTLRAAAPTAALTPSAMHTVSLFVDRLINNGRVNLASAVVHLLETGADANSTTFAFLKYKVREASGGAALPFDTYDIQPAATEPPEPIRPNTGFQGTTPGFQGATPGFQGGTSGFQGTTPGFQGATPGFQAPTSGFQAATPGYQPPQTGFQSSTPGYQAPGSGFQPPPPTGFQPPSSGGFQPPSSGGFQPPSSGGFQPPSSGGFQPPSSGGFQPPSGGFQGPSSGFQGPSSGFQPQSGAPYQNSPQFPPQHATFGRTSPAPRPPFSTHPAAGVGQLSSGLPTPWPIPTEAQQKRSGQPAPPAASGAPCPPGDVQKIHGSLMQLLNIHSRNGEDPRKLEEHRLRFQELTQQLETGQVGKEAQAKLLDLSNAVQKMDWITASKCQQDLTQIAWSKTNKNWILALKRLSAGPSMRTAPVY